VILHTNKDKGKTKKTSRIRIQTKISQLLITTQTKALTTWFLNSVLELNTKNIVNSPSFLTITHTILPAKRFRSYEILTIDVAAKFCPWMKQRKMDL
jgi:hypothetical protein